MNRLTNVKNASIIALLVPFSAAAEFTPLSDSSMRATVGQAGVTIDLSANVDISEVAYQDQGYLFINGISLGGAAPVQSALGQTVTGGSALDNLRITIDVAGTSGADLASPWGLAKFDSTEWSASADNQGDHGEQAVPITDGDLVIGLGAADQSELVDFGLQIDRVTLGSSSLLPGQGGAGNPSNQIIMDNVLLTGNLGPTDIVVDADSNNLNINSYFSLDGSLQTDLYIPLLLDWQEVGMNLRMHNERGEDVLKYTNTAGEVVSFAHVQADVGASSAPNGGLRVNLTDLSGDLDTTNITFAGGASIGDVYWTDVQVSADLNIYGH
ncbi:DUF6160 family protein [Marinobacter sp. CHS3-4]|uniref:DUF6160 family protein n=1 Tax=Marinobacter sp. CHS3-4 TaxID=3045174 RepID=UPI0024B594C4|nr:DUF6160 family protein [Marinobacter sp. CHS3-4]MDI9244825.1 DUF6160 family protein [Marinobacter sp. CHS3-4]